MRRNSGPHAVIANYVRKVIVAPVVLASAGLILFGLARAQPAPADPVSVYPAPGTRTASPRTQVSFRGVAADALGTVTVTGSRSGRHAGTVRQHSDGRGASFVPSSPFRAGERVTVRTGLHVTGASHGDYAIGIARPAKQPPIRPQPRSSVGRGDVRRFASRPDLLVPAVAVTTAKPDRAPGLVFIAPKGGHGQDGPMILDGDGRLVWFDPMPKNTLATDLRVQRYRGRPVLTWWQGGMMRGDGRGVGEIYDSAYRRVAEVHAGNGYSADLHEFTITPNGTALLVAYESVEQDLRSAGGPRHGVAIDCVVQEVDIKTGLVEFEWHSLGNVALAESHVPVPHGDRDFDYIHVNSVALDQDGNFIVSARNTWTVYKVERSTAQVVWRLGGERSSFTMGPGTVTAWQHDARPHPNGTLTIYDNGASSRVHKASRALTLKVDERAKRATLVSALVHPRGLLSARQGSVQPLTNGETFVGAGSQRYSEYAPDGSLVFDGHLARGNDTYRAYLMRWSGRPTVPPRVAATRSGTTVTAHASWNGATDVARWQLLAGTSAGALAPVADAPSAGFETRLRAATTAPYVAVRALDADGSPPATSAAQRPRA